MAAPHFMPVRLLPPKASEREIVDAVNTIIRSFAQHRGADYRAYTDPVTEAYAIDDGDWSVYVDASATATVAISLPSAALYPGRILHVQKIDGSDNMVKLVASGTEDVNVAQLWTISQWFNWVLQSDGISDWYSIK